MASVAKQTSVPRASLNCFAALATIGTHRLTDLTPAVSK